MKRFLSQRIMCSEKKLLLNTIIEKDDDGKICKLIPLNESNAEISQTTFYNGIITPGIVSLHKRATSAELKKNSDRYNIISIDEIISGKVESFDIRPSILDLKTENPETVSTIIRENINFFNTESLFEVINALVFFPAEALGVKNIIESGEYTNLLLWPSPESVEVKKNLFFSIKQL